MLNRRDWLKGSTVLSLAPLVPNFLMRTAWAAEPQRSSRVLVVVELEGGNDGINTVVPFGDEGYARARKELRLPKDKLLPLADGLGLHPSLRGIAGLLERRQFAIIQGVGYPNPDRSHFRSQAIWHAATTDQNRHTGQGWLGLALDDFKAVRQPTAFFVGSSAVPAAVVGHRSAAAAISQLEDYAIKLPADRSVPAAPAANLRGLVERRLRDAQETCERLSALAHAEDKGARYPESEFGQKMHLIARLIKADLGVRVFYTSQTDYDTHVGQLQIHARLLGEWSSALSSFMTDLTATGFADQVAVLTFSEFGRRVAENGSLGTDHGTAAPVFLAGGKVQPGLIGATPKLLDLEEGDLKMGIDFRRVYATLLEDWLDLRAKPALGGEFERLQLFRS
jgi:uncharacterized protein (DUF1501 family)